MRKRPLRHYEVTAGLIIYGRTADADVLAEGGIFNLIAVTAMVDDRRKMADPPVHHRGHQNRGARLAMRHLEVHAGVAREARHLRQRGAARGRLRTVELLGLFPPALREG